jgi:hypothetical protein
MTDKTALDGRPDVDIKLRGRKNPDETKWYIEIEGTAECRFCPEAFNSPDPRSLVRWADKHEESQGHILTKQEMQQSVLVAPPERPVMIDGNWSPDGRPDEPPC